MQIKNESTDDPKELFDRLLSQPKGTVFELFGCEGKYLLIVFSVLKKALNELQSIDKRYKDIVIVEVERAVKLLVANGINPRYKILPGYISIPG